MRKSATDCRSSFELANVISRGLARVVDGSLISLCVLSIVFVPMLFSGFVLPDPPTDEASSWGFEVVPILVFIIFETLFIGRFGMTPGKMLGKTGDKILVLRTDGSPLGYGRAFVRALAVWIYCLPYYLGESVLAVSIVVMLFGRDRRTLHDWISGSVVFRS